MTRKKKPKISNEKGIDFMSDIEFDRFDKEAILATIVAKTKKECRKSLQNESVGELKVSEETAAERAIEIKLAFAENKINNFFLKVENATSSILFDLDMDKRRPTISEAVEVLNRIKSKSRDLSQLLDSIDYVADKALKKKGYDAFQLSELLENLSNNIEEEVLAEIKQNKSLFKSLHPYRIMSANVIQALDELGVLIYFQTDRAKVSLIEEVIRHALESSAVDADLAADEAGELTVVYLKDHIISELKNFQPTKIKGK